MSPVVKRDKKDSYLWFILLALILKAYFVPQMHYLFNQDFNSVLDLHSLQLL